MESIAKAPQTLSARNDSNEILSKAKTNYTGTLPRLPLELLIQIIEQFPSHHSACSLARVNKAFHYYSIRRIYASFYIHTDWLLDLADREDHWIHEYSSVNEMLQIFDIKGPKDLYGLFSRPEHLAAVRHLIVRNQSLWDRRKMPITRTIVSKILKEIFNGATALQTAAVDDSRNVALPFCLMNVSYAHTFTSLSITSLSLGTWESILLGVPSLKEISCDNFERDFLKSTEYANPRIYRWSPRTTESLRATLLDVTGIYSWLPIVMLKLRRLSIHHILRAPSRSENGGVAVFDFSVPSASYVAISKQIREHCVSLVRNLQNLQDFTMTLEAVGEIDVPPPAHHQGAYTELEQKGIIEEEAQLVNQLSIGNPNLTRMKMGYSWGNWAGVIRTFNFSTFWKKIGTSLSEKSTDTVIWTPHPHSKPCWWFWFAAYRTPQHVHEMMVNYWEQSDIPSLIDLERWYSQNVITN